MKNILLFLSLMISINSFSLKKWDSLPVNLDGVYFSDTSSTVRINTSNAVTVKMKSYIGEYTYSFSALETNFKSVKTSQETNNIKLKNLQIVSVPRGEHNNSGKILKNSNPKGEIIFKVGGTISIKKDVKLNGRYISNNAYIILKSNEEYIEIPIFFIINMEKSLKLEVKPMDLGKIIIGEKASTKYQGTPGWLYIEGKSSEIEISYPKKIEIFNGKSDKLIVDIISDMPINPRIDESGNLNIRFDGEIKNTKKAIPGSYRGDLVIKVKYEN